MTFSNLPAFAIGILLFIISYMIGSVSFAVIAGHLIKGLDIRHEGSGNAGSTNVFRVLGWKAAVIVLILDAAKGFIPVLRLPRIFMGMVNFPLLFPILTLSGILIGHAFPLWFGFRGGKGVASAAGGIIAMFPQAAPICLIIFISVLAVSRYVSLASLAAAWTLPIFTLIWKLIRQSEISFWLIGFFILTALAVSWLHRKNIGRLFQGNEPKFTFRTNPK